MLIVFSGNTSWSMYNFRLGVMKHFLKLGYRVCVVAPEDEYSKKILAEGIQFIPVKNLKRSGNNPIKDFVLFIEYVKIYKFLKPDFIFHYTIKPNIYGALAAKFTNIKNISITTGLGYAFSNKGLLYYFVKYLYKLSLSYPLEVWFLNSDDQIIFIKNKIVLADKSYLLPGEGVDTNFFKPSTITFKSDITTFILISRMLYDKGIKEYIDASKILKENGYNISCLLLGQIDNDNPEAITIETITEWQKEGFITYLGQTTDVKSYIAKAHVVVLPSYREGVPRILLEAASMGIPIITSEIPGCTEVVEDGINGFLCDKKDSVDLAAKMENFILLTNEERIKMGNEGRKKMLKDFDEKIIIDIYIKKCEQYLF